MVVLAQHSRRVSSAAQLAPQQRQEIAVQALAGQPVTQLAQQNDVSRKFVYQIKGQADQALEESFAPTSQDDEVLFQPPSPKLGCGPLSSACY